jgi:type IV pilus assembly protein PilP
MIRAFLVLLLLSLAGCGDGGDFSDLQAYMEEVRSSPRGGIEPLPQPEPYESFTYAAADLRPPFQPPVKIEMTSRPKGDKAIKPDETRIKQFLEGFNIDVFEMVGTLANAQGSFALISGAGGVHRVTVGDYLGRNDGRIVAVDSGKIEVIELVPDGDGGWLERPRTLSLKGGSEEPGKQG